MKANAPEKIYIDADENWHRTHTAYTEKAKGNDIEYTRTDAFIEKAATWFANRYQANGSYLCAKDIEDFRKSMGE